MSIDLRELGSKCGRLRHEILKLTVGHVAARTGIAVERVSAIEDGIVEPSGDEVLILADALGEPVDYFITNERSASIEKASDLYRMYGGSFATVDRLGIQDFLRLCRMGHEIESLLGARPRVIKFDPAPLHHHMKAHGRLNAEPQERHLVHVSRSGW